MFREVHRVLKPEGTLWLNLGDCYVSAPSSGHGWDKSTLTLPKSRERKIQHAQRASRLKGRKFEGLKPKDMVGMPWTVALALRNEGWYLRRDIIWHKLSPMPEAVKDRPTSAHEYLFLLAKSRRYYYDAEAIKRANRHRQPCVSPPGQPKGQGSSWLGHAIRFPPSPHRALSGPKAERRNCRAHRQLCRDSKCAHCLEPGHRALPRRAHGRLPHRAREALHPRGLSGRRACVRSIRRIGDDCEGRDRARPPRPRDGPQARLPARPGAGADQDNGGDGVVTVIHPGVPEEGK